MTKLILIGLLLLVNNVVYAKTDQAIFAGASVVFAEAVDTGQYKNFNKAQRLKELTPLQYNVTQKGGTEKPFDNAYWNNKSPGIYVDIVSGEPLFSSTDKFDSGAGWPSFTKPIDDSYVVLKKRRNWFGQKIMEVKSKYADSHLGDLFHDGPPPSGLRYCLDSAALNFIPAEDLEKKGYSQFKYLFESPKTGKPTQ